MGDEAQPKHEVFISYSSKDKKWADAACAVLEKHRVRCWVAPRDITPGTEWGAAIISGMDASKIMVLIFSANANQSAQVRREVERAIGKGLIVLPFRIEDVSPAGAMEYALSNTHWLDGFTKPLERQFDLLAKSVKALLANGPVEPAEPILAPTEITPAPAPARPYTRLLIAVGSAVLTLLFAGGLYAVYRNGSVQQPIHDTALESDQDKIQGRWQVVIEERISKKGYATTDVAVSKPNWTFRGTDLTAVHSVDGNELVMFRGTFSLRTDGQRKLIDFNGMNPDGRSVEFRGIYEFEDEFLKVAHYFQRPGADATKKNWDRPDSFSVITGRPGASIKFRRTGRGMRKGAS